MAPLKRAPEPPKPRAVDAALATATHAVDAHSRRAALDRLSARLAQQAARRGRRAVPKRPPRDAGVAD